ncbi:DUF6932 family protein [Nocardia noduli]|uniref:DUF6932 family protein n=1 Tax=Nocardia noduli TaxID=2815722 RepID=UPI001C237F95|nr:hypothetical protein [Nocardia noduli]
MVLPDFVDGHDGYQVLPPGRWPCTAEEFEKRFVSGLPDEPRRRQIFEDVEEYQRQQARRGLTILSYWIDGSFTSAKLNPGDIDVTAVVDGATSQPTSDWKDWFDPTDRWKSVVHPDVGRPLLVDGFGIMKLPDSHPAHRDYLLTRGYWDDWWQRCRGTGAATSKGYVEVKPWT